MFFETNYFSLSNISAFAVDWNENVGTSGVRPYHALSFRVTGEAEFSCKAQTVHVGSGDIIFVPAYCQYNIIAGTEELFVIHFNTDVTISDSIKKFSTHRPANYRHYFEEIVDVYIKKEVGFEHECKSLLYMVLANMERESNSREENAHDKEIQNAVKYIRRNITQKNISIHELSAMCSMSETYFRKRFAKIYGCSPLTYINNLRSEYAVEMLKTKYYTVSEVSDKCGFSTPYYFSNFIKNKTGHSPISFIKD